jgi:hypothetical protein
MSTVKFVSGASIAVISLCVWYSIGGYYNLRAVIFRGCMYTEGYYEPRVRNIDAIYMAARCLNTMGYVLPGMKPLGRGSQ